MFGFFKKKEQSEITWDNDVFEEMDESIRPGGMFRVQLLMKERCEMPSVGRMADILSQHIGEVETMRSSDEMTESVNSFAHFFATEHIAQFADGPMPAQVLIMPCEAFHPEEIDEMTRAQMWECPQDILQKFHYCVSAFDLMSGVLHPLERANFLMDYLEALVEMFPSCEAVYSLNTGNLILADTIRNPEVEGLDRFVRYIVNARLFNIADSRDQVVDTVGMSLLYIEDMQYYFHDMDPNWIVQHAYCMASYILQNQRPIKEGDTIDGVTDGIFDQSIRWKCHFDDALIQPKRAVLDVHMNEYAAGKR